MERLSRRAGNRDGFSVRCFGNLFCFRQIIDMLKNDVDDVSEAND